MRTHFILVSVAVAIAACADQQQPTSPVGRQGPSVRADEGVRVPVGAVASSAGGNAKPTPPPPPPDQVGFTKVTVYNSDWVDIPAYQTGYVLADCPPGTARTGGGHEFKTFVGGYPLVLQSRPHELINSWVAVVINGAPGAVPISLRAWVACAS